MSNLTQIASRCCAHSTSNRGAALRPPLIQSITRCAITDVYLSVSSDTISSAHGSSVTMNLFINFWSAFFGASESRHRMYPVSPPEQCTHSSHSFGSICLSNWPTLCAVVLMKTMTIWCLIGGRQIKVFVWICLDTNFFGDWRFLGHTGTHSNWRLQDWCWFNGVCVSKGPLNVHWISFDWLNRSNAIPIKSALDHLSRNIVITTPWLEVYQNLPEPISFTRHFMVGY